MVDGQSLSVKEFLKMENSDDLYNSLGGQIDSEFHFIQKYQQRINQAQNSIDKRKKIYSKFATGSLNIKPEIALLAAHPFQWLLNANGMMQLGESPAKEGVKQG